MVLHSGLEHTLLFTILSIISSFGVVKLITKSTFLSCFASILSNSSACFMVLGNPSKTIPSCTSFSFSLFSISCMVRSAGTKFPFDI